jgi:hypothetical protein
MKNTKKTAGGGEIAAGRYLPECQRTETFLGNTYLSQSSLAKERGVLSSDT